VLVSVDSLSLREVWHLLSNEFFSLFSDVNQVFGCLCELLPSFLWLVSSLFFGQKVFRLRNLKSHVHIEVLVQDRLLVQLEVIEGSKVIVDLIFVTDYPIDTLFHDFVELVE